MTKLIGFLVLASLGACSTLKMDVRRVNKAIERHRDTVASITRNAFPCTTTKIDTVTTTKIDSITVECPDSVIVRGKDTIRVKGKTVYVPRETRYVEITKTIEDSAKIVIMFGTIRQRDEQIAERNKVIGERDATIADQDRKIERRGEWNLYLIAAVVALAVLCYLQFRRK